jgi:site-specific recombinase
VAGPPALVRLLDSPAGGVPDAGREQAWFELLLRWLLQRDRLPSLGAPDRSGRLRALAAVVDEHPQREALLARMSAVWSHASAVRLLAEMGLPDHPSFLKEAAHRLTDRFVPLLDAQEDLYALVDRLRLTEDEARWLESLPAATLQRWSAVLAPSARSYAVAATLLSVRAAALGLSRELIARDDSAEGESAFLTLPEVVRALAHQPGDAALLERWNQTRRACEQVVARTLSRLDRRGLSVELVYRLELVRATLWRLDQLLLLANGGGDGFALAVELVRGSASQHSLGELLRGTLRSLALRVVEHTAHTGEHYIASSPAEWWAMLRSASGGGALTALTAAFKYGLAALPLAPAVMGMAHALNYSLSFIALQLLGLSLASKQPAMTGSALADALDQQSGQAAEIALVASISRTQLIAAVGNVALAVPVALLLDVALRLLSGHPLLSVEQAGHGLLSLHPLRSLTLPFAAITGVFLWISSLAAGLSANWSAFRSLPQAVARSARLRGLLGEHRARWLGVQVGRHFSGVVAYLVLGLLLGFVPVLFQFAGVGLEVRHVTLSAAALAFDASALYSAGRLTPGPLLWAGAGIALIGLLNFGVSFALGLRVALQARGLVAVDRRRLLRGLLAAFVRSPRQFFFPPRT